MRIVSLVPSITENLILFGVTPVGRTSFCIEPREQVQNIPVVGGTKNPKIDKILELQPDLVIANQEENRKEDVEEMKSRGMNVWITYPKTVLDSIALMKEFQNKFELSEKNQAVIQACENAYNQVSANRPTKPISVVTFIWKNPWMVSGGDTYMNDLIEVAGGTNPFQSLGRYPEVTVEDILTLAPDLLLLPSEPYAFKEKDKIDWEMKCKANGLFTRVELVNGEDLCWFGPRISQALPTFHQLIRYSTN